MEKSSNENLKKNFGISKKNNSIVEEALRKATREALKKHQIAGNKVAVWNDGKVVLIEPDEIIKDESDAPIHQK